MKNIKLLIAYDGTDFSGWQRQSSDRSVQAEIETALEKVCKVPVTLTGSGRTDAGVHAAGQAANFFSPLDNIPAARYVPALNTFLPQDVRVLDARETLPDFHARFDAKMRTYRYSFIAGRRALPQESRYALQLWRRPRLDVLNECCRLLPGEKDCTAFASPADKSHSRSRYIFQAWFFMRGDTLIFEIAANAFLWKMVRTIAGTLLMCDEKDLGAAGFADILYSRDRRRAGPALPPQGLSLWKVDYYRE